MFSGLGVLLIQDGTSIKQVDVTDWSTTDIVTGLTDGSYVFFHEFEGRIFWTDAYACGILDISTDPGTGVKTVVSNPWGAVPPGELQALSGVGGITIPYGTYSLCVTSVGQDGVESGASLPIQVQVGLYSKVDVAADGYDNDGTPKFRYEQTTQEYNVSISVASHDANAAYYRVYMSHIGGGKMFWAFDTPLDADFAIPQAMRISNYPLKTLNTRGPIPGYGVFSYRKIIGTYRGRWIYPSLGHSVHLFSPQQFTIFVPHEVCAIAEVADGLWVATTGGMFFISGDSPQSLTVRRIDNARYAKGSLVEPGQTIPAAETANTVALFVNANGVVAGKVSGQLLELTRRRYEISSVADKYAKLAVVDNSGIKQVLITLASAAAEVEEFTPEHSVPTPIAGAAAEAVVAVAPDFAATLEETISDNYLPLYELPISG
jgi:hypothetical protein